MNECVPKQPKLLLWSRYDPASVTRLPTASVIKVHPATIIIRVPHASVIKVLSTSFTFSLSHGKTMQFISNIFQYNGHSYDTTAWGKLSTFYLSLAKVWFRLTARLGTILKMFQIILFAKAVACPCYQMMTLSYPWGKPASVSFVFWRF